MGLSTSHSSEWQVRHAYSAQNHLAEGPIWDPEAGCLYWVNLFRNQMFRWSPTRAGVALTISFDTMVSAVGLRKDGLILASNLGFVLTDVDGNVERWIDFPVSLQPGAHANDGAVDRSGRFWAGSASGAEQRNHLFCLKADGHVAVRESGIGISNGIAWSLDNKTMYYVDSRKSMIYAYDFDLEAGAISNRRPFVDTHDGIDTPDGITIDSEGCIWCARWDGWKITRYTPDGAIEREIMLPVQRPTSCIFGGEAMRTLYITSARAGLDNLQLAQQPLAGDIFAIDLPVHGFPETRFGD